MARYVRRMSDEVEAITFDELVEHGRRSGVPLYNNMPWAFLYQGHPITNENEDCYLIPADYGSAKFGRDDLLVTGRNGKLIVVDRAAFEATYEPAS